MLETISFSIIAVSIIALLATQLNMFYPSILVPVSVAIIIIPLLYKILKIKKIYLPQKSTVIVFIIILLFSILNLYLFHDTHSGGNDEGVYTNSSYLLIKSHGLKLNEYVNFPTGWISSNKDNSEYKSMFYPAYTSWLAINVAIMGKLGLSIANVLPVFLALIYIHLITLQLAKTYKTAIICTILLISSYPMFWFTRITYTENLSIFLVWFSLHSLISYFINREKKCILFIFMAYTVFVFCRLEAVFMLLPMIVILIYISKKDKNNLYLIFGLSILLISIFLAYTFTQNSNYFNLFVGQINSRFGTSLINTDTEHIGSRLNLPLRDYFPQFVFYALNAYNLYLPILFVIPCLLYIYFRKDRKKTAILAFILINTLPTFYYLYKFYITPEQPYFLRRFYITVFPVSILCMSIFLEKFQKNKLLYLSVIGILVSINIIVSAPIIFFSENKGVINNIEQIAAKINQYPDKKIILVDSYVADRYKMADPLYFKFGIKTFWIDNLSQLKEIKKNVLSFETYNLYLLTNSQRKQSFEKDADFNNLSKMAEFPMSFKQLLRTVDLNHIKGRPDDVYDIAFSDVKKLISAPNKIIEKEYDLVLYKVGLIQQ